MTRSASKAQAIPEPTAQLSSRGAPGAAATATPASERRMTRAAARAAMEAGEVPPPSPGTDAAAGGGGGSGSSPDDAGPQPMDAAFASGEDGGGGRPSSDGHAGSDGTSDHDLEDGVMLQAWILIISSADTLGKCLLRPEPCVPACAPVKHHEFMARF